MTRVRNRSGAFFFLLACLLPAGCGPQGGAMLYYLGAGDREKVAAQFTLSKGPILVLVDDLGERVVWPEAREMLSSRLADELLANKATEKVIAVETLQHARRTEPNFDKRGCREVGRMVGADQVLWVEVVDFFASEALEDIGSATRIAVTVKVIDPKGTVKQQNIRLWPVEHDGRPVKVELSSNDVSRARTRQAIAQELTSRLAGEIARLFYEHRLQDLVKP
jgi:hypothetical protein